jgi:hypothetical protein
MIAPRPVPGHLAPRALRHTALPGTAERLQRSAVRSIYFGSWILVSTTITFART